MVMKNQTAASEFILLGLSTSPHLQIFLFLVFFVIYIITLLGNAVIILVVHNDPHLHTPMYFFLGNLSFIDICYSSVIVPNMLHTFLVERKIISLSGCITQIFFFLFFATVEGLVLTAMAYDRYVAICHPLHYTAIMKRWVHIQLACGAWVTAFFYSLMNTLLITDLHFCKPSLINHFSCEPPQLFKISCSDPFTNQLVIFTIGATLWGTAFLITLSSYVLIISVVLRLHSVEGKRKAFSTCSSHLIVIFMYYVPILFRYLKPTPHTSQDQEKLISVVYLIITPMLNPIIYSLRNQEVKKALGNFFRRTG
ncbi:olfactory receptor 5V1-like [Alligator sinensis]|uniref:Olfactory receptor n=1 Tax=Alligator sinensis TaxID=38654 RepID=A0A3Q0FWY2_ALLSI|nr:olfactory receptor 5V1-like [Alligator sinensis]